MEFYSHILSLGALGIFIVTVVHAAAYTLSAKVRTWTNTVPYDDHLRLIGALALSSSLLALGYQFIYNLQVCILCWWQRIWMFPIDIIIPVSLYYRVRHNHIITGVLALIGSFFAGYHYYYHFQAWVLGNFLEMPCEMGGLLPACVDNEGVLNYGFITIPFMALSVFIAIIWQSYLAHQKATR